MKTKVSESNKSLAARIQDAALSPLERARKESFEKRQKLQAKKAAESGKHYTARFNEYLNEYFNNFADSKEENQVAYDILNKSWKRYANEANAVQKLVTLRVNSFEEEVARIVKQNVQFQANHPLEVPEEIIDLTNLKSE